MNDAVPLKRSPDLPPTWAKASLGSLGGWFGGGTPSKDTLEYWNGGSIPWVSPKDMKVARIVDTEDHITEQAVRNSATSLVPTGAVLMVTRSGILRHTFPVAVAAIDVTLNQDMKALAPFEGIDGDYIAATLRAFEGDVLSKCAKDGTTVQSVEFSRLKDFQIPIAPVNEQQRIVAKIDELFSELDAGVANLERARALLKQYRQAVLKAAVTGELTRDLRERHKGQIEESGCDLLQRILKTRRQAWEAAELTRMRAKGKAPKDERWKQKYKEPQQADTTGLPALPDGWVWATMQQLCEATRPISYGVLQPGADVSNGVPLVRVGDVSEGHIAVGALKRIRSDIADEYRRTTLRGGEVLLTVVGSIGRTAVVPPSLAGANIARAVAMLPVSPLIRPSWVEVWLRFEPNRQCLEDSAHEVARKTLNLEDVRDFAVPVPPNVEQDRIIEKIEDHDSVIDVSGDATSTIARQASSLRQSILKAAFAGKLVPQDPNDEPASVLLERIRAERAASPRPARGRQARKVPGGRQLELL